jgi:hypothetical protein
VVYNVHYYTFHYHYHYHFFFERANGTMHVNSICLLENSAPSADSDGSLSCLYCCSRLQSPSRLSLFSLVCLPAQTGQMSIVHGLFTSARVRVWFGALPSFSPTACVCARVPLPTQSGTRLLPTPNSPLSSPAGWLSPFCSQAASISRVWVCLSSFHRVRLFVVIWL